MKLSLVSNVNDVINLKDKVAVITGSATIDGIGMATARLFEACGAKVAMLDLADKAPESMASQAGDGARGYICDVTDQTQCVGVLDQVAKDLGGIDILTNNAGIVYGTPFSDIEGAEYDRVMDVNLRGNFNMSQAVVPHFRRGGGGVIICISSIAGQVGGGLFGSSHYAASKGGIFSLTKALARELAPENIRVNAIAPGVIDNNFTKGRMTQKIKDEISAKIPMGRLGLSDDIAKCCLFLASDLSSYVNGAVLDVNGGLHFH